METDERQKETQNEASEFKSINLDDLLTPAQFGKWIGESESWVRRRLGSIPGVIRESRKHIRIHPRTYLEKRLKIGRNDYSRPSS